MHPQGQVSLFSQTETQTGLFVDVVFPGPVDKSWRYAVPEEWVRQVEIGKRVQAPFGRGNRSSMGYCVAVTTEPPPVPAKPIRRVLDDLPLLSPALLQLTRWIAEYYLCPWGEVLQAVVPRPARLQAGTRERTFVEAILPPLAAPSSAALTPRQQAVYTLLLQLGRPVEWRELLRQAGCGPTVLRNLIRKGYVRQTTQRQATVTPQVAEVPSATSVQLTPAQQQALQAIETALRAGRFEAFLLFGVTGSGKTEVYLRAIEHVVRQGRQAIVLVPEISLTPQTIERFRGRFPRIAVLHSHLSDAERAGFWRQIVAGEADVIIGARSAIFAPTRRLGLIVVDEEHEPSFKQETAPHYHARDVAVKRAQLENIPVVLGSATPSLESWHNALTQRYRLLQLPKRIFDRPLPPVHIVDLRHEPTAVGRPRAISPPLEEAIRTALRAGGQVILLLNRRGFDTYILCPACGHVVQCRFCSVALTYHRDRNQAVCHYCGYETAPPHRCPRCDLPAIRHFGLGTQKLEAELNLLFPDVTKCRMDSDVMRRGQKYGPILDAFRRGDIRILFGTQMIAKGLDFPQVTLVGVVNADTALYLPDFRAAERTFQLLAQVAGRTGRGERGGRVLVQTYNPDHPCIRLAAHHDYVAFAEQELAARRALGYPPYGRMARLVVRSRRDDLAYQAAQTLAAQFRQHLQQLLQREPLAQVQILGPAPCPLHRLRNYYRYQLVVLAPKVFWRNWLIRETLAHTPPPEDVLYSVDIDPLQVL
ncbi:MAG: primosomal protein N' [Gemmatales bacterium]|nr:primosomal protein N' [Gemmatales bacterium]MDW7994054.1 primosomal protein N' [Gemmatales bacterium]